VTRYTLSIFPLMTLGGLLMTRLRTPTAVAVVAASTAWMATVMGLFALGYWAG
jgi:hypothetical protein